MHALPERAQGRLIAVCGPTATGKTALAIRLALNPRPPLTEMKWQALFAGSRGGT